MAAANHQLRAIGPLELSIGSPSAASTRLPHTVVHAELFLSGSAKSWRTAIACSNAIVSRAHEHLAKATRYVLFDGLLSSRVHITPTGAFLFMRHTGNKPG